MAPDERAGHRICRREEADSNIQQCMGCTLEPWTGSFVFKQSNLVFDDDLDAPPDVLSVMHSKRTLKQALLDEGIERVFTCGLALDFCVFDTAINAKDAGFKEVVFLLDAARPAHVPGYLPFYGGFAHEPSWTGSQLKAAGVKVWSTGAYAAVRQPAPVELLCALQQKGEIVVSDVEEEETPSFIAAARFFANDSSCSSSSGSDSSRSNSSGSSSSSSSSSSSIASNSSSSNVKDADQEGAFPTIVQLLVEASAEREEETDAETDAEKNATKVTAGKGKGKLGNGRRVRKAGKGKLGKGLAYGIKGG
jgi:hypothetical protein